MKAQEVDRVALRYNPGPRGEFGDALLFARFPPPPSSSHAALLSNERSVIEAYLSTKCRTACFDPLDVFVIVADLRGDFGRRLGLHVFDRVTLDRRIRRAMAGGGLPSLSVPIALDHGVALVELMAPESLPWQVEHPPLSVSILAVDAEGVPRLAFGRLRDRSLQ